MSGFSPFRGIVNPRRGCREENAPGEDNDSDCEVDGSFIILANNPSASSPQANEGTVTPLPGVNLNVFQVRLLVSFPLHFTRF